MLCRGKRNKRFRGLLSLALSCVLLFCFFKLIYGERYEGAQQIGETVRRIPLNYPYEIISEAPFGEVQLHEWSTFGVVVTSDRHGFMSAFNQRGALNGISKFQIRDGIFCGVKEPLLMPFRTSLVPDFVLLTTDPISFHTYENKEEFVKACRAYGIDRLALDDFSANYERYWNGMGRMTPRRVLASFWREPFSAVEWMVVLICLILIVKSFVQVCRGGNMISE